MGILWGDINHGFSLSSILRNTIGQEPRINPARSQNDLAEAASVIFNPYRVTICDGGLQTLKTKRAHYPVPRRSDLFSVINAKCRVFYEEIMSVAPEPEVPYEKWGELVSGRGVLVEFRAVITQEIIKHFMDTANAPPGAPTEMRKLLILPEENAGRQSVCLYVLAKDRVVRVLSPSANYYDTLKLINDGLHLLSGGDVSAGAANTSEINDGAVATAERTTAADSVATTSEQATTTNSQAAQANTQTTTADSQPAQTNTQTTTADTQAAHTNAQASSSKYQAATTSARHAQANEQATSKKSQAAATSQTATTGQTATTSQTTTSRQAATTKQTTTSRQAATTKQAVSAAAPKPGDTPEPASPPELASAANDSGSLRFKTIREVGGGRFPDFSPDVFCIVEGPKTSEFRAIRYDVPTGVRGKSELEGKILSSDIYSYNRSIDYNDTIVFKNITSIYRLYKDGFMEYNYIPLTQPADKGASAAALENALAFVLNIEKKVLDNPAADLVLSGIDENASDLTHRFTFDYIIDDYPVYFNYEQTHGDTATRYRNAITILANANRVVSCRWMLVDLFFATATNRMHIYFDRIEVDQSLPKMAVTDIAIAYSIDLTADPESEEYPFGKYGSEWPVWAITSPDGSVEIVGLSEG